MLGILAHAALDVAWSSGLPIILKLDPNLHYDRRVFGTRTLRSELLLERVDDEIQGAEGVPCPEGQAQDAEDRRYAFEVPGDGAAGDG